MVQPQQKRSGRDPPAAVGSHSWHRGRRPARVLELNAAEQHLYALGVNLYVGFGDERAAARRSRNRARRPLQLA
jgi:hypothetical protein